MVNIASQCLLQSVCVQFARQESLPQRPRGHADKRIFCDTTLEPKDFNLQHLGTDFTEVCPRKKETTHEKVVYIRVGELSSLLHSLHHSIAPQRTPFRIPTRHEEVRHGATIYNDIAFISFRAPEEIPHEALFVHVLCFCTETVPAWLHQGSRLNC